MRSKVLKIGFLFVNLKVDTPYHYVSNNPISRIDPDGKDWIGYLYQMSQYSNSMNNWAKSYTESNQLFSKALSAIADGDLEKAEKYSSNASEKLDESNVFLSDATSHLGKASVEFGDFMIKSYSGDFKNALDNGEYIEIHRGVNEAMKPYSFYENAKKGIAIPKGHLPESPIPGGHEDKNDHTMGDNYSIWTSWTTNYADARRFASGVALRQEGYNGVVMTIVVPVSSLKKSELAELMQEDEVLVEGVVHGAKVEVIKKGH